MTETISNLVALIGVAEVAYGFVKIILTTTSTNVIPVRDEPRFVSNVADKYVLNINI